MAEDTQDFTLPLRVYYENTDAGGVVYHAEYLRFFERARTEWLRDLGVDQSKLREQANILFTVRSMTIEYLRPARLDDELLLSVFTDEVRRASLHLSQAMYRVGDAPEDGPLATAQVRVAVIDAQRFKACPAPKEIIERITTTVRKSD